MVKTPRTRHSKAPREPLTIDLTPADAERAEQDHAPSVFDTKDADTASANAGSEPFVDRETSIETGQAATDFVEPASSGSGFRPSTRETMEDRETLADAAADDEGYGFDKIEKPKALETEKRIDPSATVPPRRGASSYLAAGFAGGVIALIIALLVQMSGLLAGAGDGRTRADVEGLRQEVEAIRAAGGGDLKGQVDTLAASLDAVRTDLAGVKDSVAAAGGGTGGALQTLDERLKQVETVVAGLNQEPGGVGAAEVAALGERIAGIEALVKAASDSTSGAIERLTALEQSVTALQGSVDAQAQQPKIALAIATAALKAAVDRGTPFLAELESFSAIAPNAAEVAALRPYAENGVATREALLAESDTATGAMIAAASPADPDAGLLDRLLDSAGTLVSVKPIGDIQGAGVPETLARMQVALAAGDLEKAMAEYETLSEPAKGVGAAFAARVKARLEAQRLVDQAIANAMKA